jgi:ATP-dependent DNA helicase RecG
MKGIRSAFLHGQMPSSEKESIMSAFAAGKIDLLVATTVIEVGVDVPNATVMVIENADRFGLSQLHQLRGRVGRGGAQSYCILLADPVSPESKQRIKTMCSTGDGFRIAEADLQLRGPGEVCGIRQHGVTDFRVADLIKDRDVLISAREQAFEIVEKDRMLEDLPLLRQEVLRRVGKVLELVETG